MQTTRRENIATVAGHQVWRQRARLMLTPRAVKAEMIEQRRLSLTPLDKLLSDHEADVLERWAANEQVLAGKAKTQTWGQSTGGIARSECAPISDHRIAAVMHHSAIKKLLSDWALEALSAFTAIQNRHEDALSPAQYGLLFGLNAKNKSQAFFAMVIDAADELILHRY
jgi:hypothetical protein